MRAATTSEDREDVDRSGPTDTSTGVDAPAGERYLLLADISGYTGFMAGVEQEHGVEFVRQVVGSGSDLLGPAVTPAHRLLKNTIRERIGFHPYLFLSDPAAAGLGVADVGFEHREVHGDAGPIQGRVVELGGAVSGDIAT